MPTAVLATGPTVHYTDTGPAGARVLVFSHGLLMDASMFDPQVADLGGDYRCICWDQRGFGRTVWDGQPFSFWDSAADLLALLDHLGIAEAVLVGMSQGGFVSLRAALLAPARVAGLVFIDSQAGCEPEEARPLYEAMSQVWLAEGPGGVGETVASMILGPAGGPVDAGPWLRRWESLDRAGLTTAFRALMDRDDLTARLPEVTAPALVLHGTEDVSIPLERAQELASGLASHPPLVPVEGAPHAANLSHPAVVNAALRGFLAELG
ncbi:MAG: alpha/beta fold hydrolase [Mycobacteriales bacterium]